MKKFPDPRKFIGSGSTEPAKPKSADQLLAVAMQWHRAVSPPTKPIA